MGSMLTIWAGASGVSTSTSALDYVFVESQGAITRAMSRLHLQRLRWRIVEAKVLPCLGHLQAFRICWSIGLILRSRAPATCPKSEMYSGLSRSTESFRDHEQRDGTDPVSAAGGRLSLQVAPPDAGGVMRPPIRLGVRAPGFNDRTEPSGRPSLPSKIT